MELSTPTRHKDDPGTTTDELEEIYFQLFSATAKIHMLHDLGSHLLDQTKVLLDAVLANISELMTREDEEDEPNIKRSWWEQDHWLFR